MDRDLARREAAARASEVLKGEWDGVLPVDPVAIARAKDIKVVHEPLSGASGCLLRAGSTFGIVVSTAMENLGYERFTLGHELGHYFLDGHVEALLSRGPHMSQSGFTSADPYERQADEFSAELLMPEQQFSRTIDDARPGLEGILSLADSFATSLTATAIRYAGLNPDPVAVILSDTSGKICFSRCSPPLADLIGRKRPWAGQSVNRTTGTAMLLRGLGAEPDSSRHEGSCALEDWFDTDVTGQVEEDAIRLGTYARVLTVLHGLELDDQEDEDLL